ncbi:MAG: hypothetical protein HP494_06440 [Nitrospira sp.]|nr:hypothetical protein [Nitrospira sp.]
MIIAIDGPAGVGKSTVAKLLAARLGYLYLDTGALYRAIAWKVLQSKVQPTDAEQVTALLDSTSVQMQCHNGAMQVLVDGREVTGELRTPEVTGAASIVSAIPVVREWLLLHRADRRRVDSPTSYGASGETLARDGGGHRWTQGWRTGSVGSYR